MWDCEHALWDSDAHQRSLERHGMKRVFIRCLFQTRGQHLSEQTLWGPAWCIDKHQYYFQYCFYFYGSIWTVTFAWTCALPHADWCQEANNLRHAKNQTRPFKVVHHQPNSSPSKLVCDFPYWRRFVLESTLWEALPKCNPNSRRVV